MLHPRQCAAPPLRLPCTSREQGQKLLEGPGRFWKVPEAWNRDQHSSVIRRTAKGLFRIDMRSCSDIRSRSEIAPDAALVGEPGASLNDGNGSTPLLLLALHNHAALVRCCYICTSVVKFLDTRKTTIVDALETQPVHLQHPIYVHVQLLRQFVVLLDATATAAQRAGSQHFLEYHQNCCISLHPKRK